VSVTPGRVERPDLVLEMSPDTFVRMLAEITNPMVLMLTHKIRVKGFGKMGAFGKLFPTPQPERVLNLAIAPAVAVAGPSGRESSSDASGIRSGCYSRSARCRNSDRTCLARRVLLTRRPGRL